jgi:uncharacterized protein (TIGR01440 family)
MFSLGDEGEVNDHDYMDKICARVNQSFKELLKVANLRQNQIVVVGCSSSEIQGKRIGSSSNIYIGEAVFRGLISLIAEHKLWIAIQCCEHLNRALVVERACSEFYKLDIVNVVPQLKAGGSLATVSYQKFKEPVVVEHICAHAGIDIGDTFIGMHLREVVVPVRGSYNNIGKARLTMARTRPKLVGGERAKYLM